MYRRKKQLALGTDAEIYLVERTDIDDTHPQKIKVAKIFKRKPTQTQEMFLMKVQREIIIQSMLVGLRSLRTIPTSAASSTSSRPGSRCI